MNSLTRYGLDAVEKKARTYSRRWRELSDVAITMHEALMCTLPAEAWDQVRIAVAGARETDAATVMAAAETALEKMRQLKAIVTQMDEQQIGTGGSQTLPNAILTTEEACTIISEIITATEEDQR